MALGSDLLRAFAASTSTGRSALAANSPDEDRKQKLTELLVTARQNLPDDDPRAQELDARIAQLAPELTVETAPTAQMTGRGFIQNVPGGLDVAVQEKPEITESRRKQRQRSSQRNAAVRGIRSLGLPEDRQQLFMEQAMTADDPLSVLTNARERANTLENESQTKGSLAERRKAAVLAVQGIDGISGKQKQGFVAQARAAEDPEAVVTEARRASGELETPGTGPTPLSPLEETIQKELGKTFVERRKGAQDAAESLQRSVEAQKLLDEGIVSGFGAEFIVGFGKALEQAGFNVEGTAVDNSQAFYALMAQETARIIKQFGAGTGLSDADREFAQKAAGGDITMTDAAIRQILRINRKASINAIKSVNEDAERFATDRTPANILRVPLPETGNLGTGQDAESNRPPGRQNTIPFGDLK